MIKRLNLSKQCIWYLLYTGEADPKTIDTSWVKIEHRRKIREVLTETENLNKWNLIYQELLNNEFRHFFF